MPADGSCISSGTVHQLWVGGRADYIRGPQRKFSTRRGVPKVVLPVEGRLFL